MVTIPVRLSNELASRVLPLQDRLPEIIELGLHQLADTAAAQVPSHLLTPVVEALTSTAVSYTHLDVEKRQVLYA